MEYTFSAKIEKVGINPCVAVLPEITASMHPVKGFIYVHGTINAFPFHQTLMPVKGEPYRLYVNEPMLRGSGCTVGDEAHFILEENESQAMPEIPVHPHLLKRITEENLIARFESLSPSRQKEIVRYIGHLKTEESRLRNVEKVIGILKDGQKGLYR